MDKRPTPKDERWVFHAGAMPQPGGEGLTRRVLAYTDGLMCVENTFQAGGEGPIHSHPHTRITYVVSGRFAFTIDGEPHEVTVGDTVLKKDGVPRGCGCLEDGILLDIFRPMREDFLQQTEIYRNKQGISP